MGEIQQNIEGKSLEGSKEDLREDALRRTEAQYLGIPENEYTLENYRSDLYREAEQCGLLNSQHPTKDCPNLQAWNNYKRLTGYGSEVTWESIARKR